jgi:hypothetical protein
MSSPFWLLLILGLFLQAGAVRIGPDAPEAVSDSPAAIVCAACEADACAGCARTGCSDTASVYDTDLSCDMSSSCGCVEAPFSLPVDSVPLPPSRPGGHELAAGPVWTEVRQDIPSPPSEAPHPLDAPFGVATGAVVVPPVALTVRFCAFLI